MKKRNNYTKKVCAILLTALLLITFSITDQGGIFSCDKNVMAMDSPYNDLISGDLPIRTTAIGSLNQYFPECPHQENTLIIVQFT